MKLTPAAVNQYSAIGSGGSCAVHIYAPVLFRLATCGRASGPRQRRGAQQHLQGGARFTRPPPAGYHQAPGPAGWAALPLILPGSSACANSQSRTIDRHGTGASHHPRRMIVRSGAGTGVKRNNTPIRSGLFSAFDFRSAAASYIHGVIDKLSRAGATVVSYRMGCHIHRGRL